MPTPVQLTPAQMQEAIAKYIADQNQSATVQQPSASQPKRVTIAANQPTPYTTSNQNQIEQLPEPEYQPPSTDPSSDMMLMDMPEDLAEHLFQCVNNPNDSMKLITPENIFLQQVIRRQMEMIQELATIKRLIQAQQFQFQTPAEATAKSSGFKELKFMNTELPGVSDASEDQEEEESVESVSGSGAKTEEIGTNAGKRRRTKGTRQNVRKSKGSGRTRK